MFTAVSVKLDLHRYQITDDSLYHSFKAFIASLGPRADDLLVKENDPALSGLEELDGNMLVIGHSEYPLHKAMRSEVNLYMCV